jgi:hypothetical protein
MKAFRLQQCTLALVHMSSAYGKLLEAVYYARFPLHTRWVSRVRLVLVYIAINPSAETWIGFERTLYINHAFEIDKPR